MKDFESIIVSFAGVNGLAVMWWVGWQFFGSSNVTLALPALVAVAVVRLMVAGALIWIAWESRIVGRRARRQLAHRCVRCDLPLGKTDVRCKRCGEEVWRQTTVSKHVGPPQPLSPPDNLDEC